MDMKLKAKFLDLWGKYFPKAELPITFYYTEDGGRGTLVEDPGEWRCLISQLAAVRRGQSLCFDVRSVSCGGAKRYLGFADALMPNFEYFLSCGIPGELEGERYKKSPEIVRQIMRNAPDFYAPAPYIVFKRWDKLESKDEPDVAIFYAKPDVLSGLFTLSGFDEADLNAVAAPFSAGCGSIVQYPYLEKDREHPRAVLGMFDVSARPWVQKEILTFAVPMSKFTRMIDNMEESFLITPSWERVKRRLQTE